MKTTLLSYICATVLLAPTALFAQNGGASLDDLREALRDSQNAESSAFADEEDATSESSEENDNAFEFALNNPNGEYEKNEPFSLTVKANTDGYLYVFNITPEGARVIFPNQNTSQNSIRSGEVREIPGRMAGFRWRFSGEFQTEKIGVVLAKVELNKDTIATICERYAKSPTGRFENRKWIEIDDVYNTWLSPTVDLKLKGTNDSNDAANNDRNDNNDRPESAPRRVAAFFAFATFVDSRSGEPVLDALCANTVGSCARSLRAAKDFGKFDYSFVLSGPELSEPNVYNAFDWLKKNTEPGDEIFIYWIGHGMQWPESDDERDKTHESLLLGTVLGETDDEGKPTGRVAPTAETTIQDDELAELLSQLSGRKVVLLLQTCFSGGLLEEKSFDSYASFGASQFKGETLSDFIEELADQPYNYEEFLSYVPKAMDFSDVKSASNDGSSLAAQLERLGRGQSARAGSNDVFAKTFADTLLAEIRAKDVRRDAPDLAILATSSEAQPSLANVLVGDQIVATTCGEDKLPICPLDFALLTVLTDKTGKYAKTPGKADLDDLWNVASRFIPANASRISQRDNEDYTQTPIYINNVGKAALAP